MFICSHCKERVLTFQMIRKNIKAAGNAILSYDVYCPYCRQYMGKKFWGEYIMLERAQQHTDTEPRTGDDRRQTDRRQSDRRKGDRRKADRRNDIRQMWRLSYIRGDRMTPMLERRREERRKGNRRADDRRQDERRQDERRTQDRRAADKAEEKE